MRRPRGFRPPILPLLLTLLASPLELAAQGSDPTVPSPQEFLQYPLGERFTPSAPIQAYARLVATLSPRAEYVEYGRTPEGRTLYQVVLTSPGNRPHLDRTLAAHAELAEPETSPERAAEIAATHPAVVYFTYGIHGNEASTGEAAMWTLWELVRDGSDAAAVLDSLVVVIDPVANPDGRDRYVVWYQSVASTPPNPDPRAQEHREPWPTGRFNHYLIDLNRDWAWATQPETRSRLAAWWRWNPLVHVDFHEMGYESSYFFFPPGAPINPIYPEHVLRWAERFGTANASAFDQRGWPYFTGDAYDLFYPGYGDSWPSLLGAIGMTYEQAGNGSAGLAVRRSAGDTLTLRDRALHHVVAALTTLRTAAANRTALMLDYAAAQREVGRGEADILLVPGSDTLRLNALVDHLRRQGIRLDRATSGFRVGAVPHPAFPRRAEFPAGTYRVPARQARGRLATTLLAPVVLLDAESSYDISAWSLPYAYGVEAHRTTAGMEDVPWTPSAATGAAATPAPPPGYGYLLPATLDAAPGIVQLLKAGVRVRVLSRAATIDGTTWTEGSWFVPRLGNDSLRDQVTQAGLAGLVRPIESGRAEEGVDLGSTHVWALELPRVAVLSGAGVSPSSFGAQWFFLERQLGLPFLALPLENLSDLEMGEVDLVVVPDLVAAGLGPTREDLLRDWVSAGGRLMALAGGARAVAGIFDIPLRSNEGADTPSREDLLRTRSERRRAEREEEVAGAILEVRVDSAHPLGWGSAAAPGIPGTFVLHNGRTVFEPTPGTETVAYFPAAVDVTSGMISPENLRRLEHGAWLVSRDYGRGSVTLFADDPLFRLFWRQTHRLYLNSLLIGPRR